MNQIKQTKQKCITKNVLTTQSLKLILTALYKQLYLQLLVCQNQITWTRKAYTNKIVPDQTAP